LENTISTSSPTTENPYAEVRNALKMFVFVITWLAEIEEDRAIKAAKIEARSKSSSRSSSNSSNSAWEKYRLSVAEWLLSALSLRLVELWKPKFPEAGFFSMFTKTAYLF